MAPSHLNKGCEITPAAQLRYSSSLCGPCSTFPSAIARMPDWLLTHNTKHSSTSPADVSAYPVVHFFDSLNSSEFRHWQRPKSPGQPKTVCGAADDRTSRYP